MVSAASWAEAPALLSKITAPRGIPPSSTDATGIHRPPEVTSERCGSICTAVPTTTLSVISPGGRDTAAVSSLDTDLPQGHALFQAPERRSSPRQAPGAPGGLADGGELRPGTVSLRPQASAGRSPPCLRVSASQSLRVVR